MRKVSIDIPAMTVSAQGGCIAADIEKPIGAQGYYAVFGAYNETGKSTMP
jgi:hypothetical protein